MSIRVWFRCALMLGLFLVAPRPAAAISVVEPLAFTSWRAEPETGSIGVGAAVGVMSFDVVPMVEKVFVDNSKDWAFTVDGHFPVLALPLVALYAGAGMTQYLHDPDQGDASWSGGLNVLVGAKASVLRFKPFAEIKYTFQGKDTMVYTLGTRFHLFD
jgi:hypothetical protein